MRITDNVYMLDASHHSHVYLVLTPKPVLIDTGMSFAGKHMWRELDTLGFSDIRHILLTHHDVDHIGNAARWQTETGAAVHASAEDIPFITGEQPRHSFKRYIGKLMRVSVPQNLQPFDSNASINGIQVIPTPGHTPGHVCFLYKDVLFAGDLLENKKRALVPYPAPWDWDYKMMLQSVEAIAAYPFTWVCPAHGKPIRRGSQLNPR